jgi:hypothetical protein
MGLAIFDKDFFPPSLNIAEGFSFESIPSRLQDAVVDVVDGHKKCTVAAKPAGKGTPVKNITKWLMDSGSFNSKTY